MIGFNSWEEPNELTPIGGFHDVENEPYTPPIVSKPAEKSRMNEQPHDSEFIAHRCNDDGDLKPYGTLHCSYCRQHGVNIPFKNRQEYEAVRKVEVESKPWAEGTFWFEWLEEADKLEFHLPLIVEWMASVKDNIVTVYLDYDFGLTYEFRPYESIKKGWCYNNIHEQTPLDEIVKSFIQYDLFHAFCHTSLDPNYSHLHWALYGNLKDRVKVIEAPIDI